MAFYDGWFNRNQKVELQTPKTRLEEVQETIMDTINMRYIDIPKPIESKAYDWVLFGPHNSFPLDLLEYKNSSSLHASIIDSKSKLISGEGFVYATTKEESNQWIIENFKLIPFWRKLDEIFFMVARDQETFGYSAFEVIYSMDHTRIVDMNWIDASRIAPAKRDDNGKINSYYYSENWKDIRNCVPREIPVWNPNSKDTRQIVVIKYMDNNMDYFSLPNYYSALKWIKCDALMADYNYSALQNGFSPSIVFKFYKKPTPEERRMNADAIKAQHSGTRNAGKALIFYADGKELAPDVDTLDATNIDQRLIQVADQIVQQIISGHKAHPQLLGIQTPGKLGYSSELLQSWEIFNNMVIKPERKLILDAFKEVLIYNGVTNANIQELTPIKIVQ